MEELGCDSDKFMSTVDAENISAYLGWKVTIMETSSLKTAYKNPQSLYHATMGSRPGVIST